MSEIRQDNKIPCSVGILTLNSEKGLPACLESLKDFSEMIICDGNSTDRTIEIAREYGVRVIKQYDTDEPNISCVKDKDHVRQKNMEAASCDWYFFMDADDTLSPEVVEEIREIVSDRHPSNWIYRMPTRIFIDGKEVKYEATYPSYQTRLVNRKTGAYFVNPVHDRLKFDAEEFPAGTLNNFYNFHWSKERVSNFWSYLKRYADWEIDVMPVDNLTQFLKWRIYRRLRTIAGYLLWRLPKMYLRHGFKESLPLTLELTIVRYHFRLLWRSTVKYINDRVPVVFLKEMYRGKDTNRILSNLEIRGYKIHGKILDVGGGGGKASHHRFFDRNRWSKITTLDIDSSTDPDICIDLDKESLELDAQSLDFALAFNVFEHLAERERVIGEIHTLLKEGGVLVGDIPFLVNVHPDPHDFVRLTRQGLEKTLQRAGFSTIDIVAVGGGPFLASYYQIEFVLPRFLRMAILPFVFLLDALLQKLKRSRDFREKFPLTYVFFAKK